MKSAQDYIESINKAYAELHSYQDIGTILTRYYEPKARRWSTFTTVRFATSYVSPSSLHFRSVYTCQASEVESYCEIWSRDASTKAVSSIFGQVIPSTPDSLLSALGQFVAPSDARTIEVAKLCGLLPNVGIFPPIANPRIRGEIELGGSMCVVIDGVLEKEKRARIHVRKDSKLIVRMRYELSQPARGSWLQGLAPPQEGLGADIAKRSYGETLRLMRLNEHQPRKSVTVTHMAPLGNITIPDSIFLPEK